MTFSSSKFELTPEDIKKLEQIEISQVPYQFESHLPIPPLERGGGDENSRLPHPAPQNIVGDGDGKLQVKQPTPTPINPSRFYRLSQLERLPAPTWLIDSILPEGSVTMVAGPPKSLKSFLALDWMLTLAIGREWNGHSTNPLGMTVVYSLGEGKNNLAKRISVWIMTHNLTPIELSRLEENFIVSFIMPQLRQPASVDKLIKDLHNEGINGGLIVFDTLARAMVGADENAVKDTGEAVAQMDKLRDKGWTVMFLHHTVKNVGKKGAIFRGSSNLEAAIDTSFDVFRNRESGELTVRNSNQKDDEEAQPMKFGWTKVYLDLDQKVSSLVLFPMTDIPINDQIYGLALPLSRGDILKMVKGYRHDKVVETLDSMLQEGKLVETKVGRYKMIDRPSNNPN